MVPCGIQAKSEQRLFSRLDYPSLLSWVSVTTKQHCISSQSRVVSVQLPSSLDTGFYLTFECNFSNEQTPTLFFSTLSFSATMDWHLASDSLPQMSTKLLTNRTHQFCLFGYSSCIYSNQVVRLPIQKTFFNFENPVWFQSEERKKETSVACFSHADMIHEIMISYVTTLCNINLTAC